MNEIAKKFKSQASIPHHSELWDIDPVCKNCEHFDSNHFVKTNEYDLWVETNDPNVKVKMTMKESKGGFKCRFNGVESTNPNDLKKGICKNQIEWR